MLPPTRPFVIGVAGGTASGKTTVAERLAGVTGEDHLSLLRLDAYYADQPELSLDDRAKLNYDHPDAFDWALLLDHVHRLLTGEAVPVPNYDFATFRRLPGATAVGPGEILVIEGILVLHERRLRDLMDLRVYVDTDADVRFIRRLERDMADRGRSVGSVIEQYLTTVRDMHLRFVEPTKRFADVIVPHGGRNEPALDVLLARVRELV